MMTLSRNAILLFAVALGGSPLLAADLIPMSQEQRQAMGMRTAPVVVATQSWSVAYPAQVQVPTAQLRVVSTPLSGLLESLLVAEGDAVKQGQALASILSPELLSLQRSYLQALSQLDLARSDWERDRQLLEEGIIAERRYQTTHAHYVQVRTEVEQGRQTLQLAGMDRSALKRLAEARQLSGTLTVRSPLDGVVLERIATPGQRLNALDPLYRIGRLKPLWLEIHVPLERLSQIAMGSTVRVTAPAVEGRVITIGRMVHGADQGVLVRAEVNAGAERLHPGQFIEVELASGRAGHHYRIPLGALVRQGGKAWVFVARDTGFLAMPVTIRAEESNAVVVSADLQPGDQVVMAGTAALKAAWLEGAE
ncbi:MAG TPA: efflux RND transporter periplasmic adaptor subunit [Gammaproteobacteria bacterium]|nr:efflux RND transporter periplasmic adaptor subunit [Gammaproteobacteria bacterium]